VAWRSTSSIAEMHMTKTGDRWKRLSLVLLLGLAWIPSALALTPVVGFELDRYLGTWYEIAAIPGFLQSRCARDTRAEYTTAENGAIGISNHCVRGDGTEEFTEARARALEPVLPSVLKVTSVHFLGIWWYPLGRESIVIAYDPGYRWVATAHPSLRYGRIVAREPFLSDDALKSIAATLGDEGFDLCAFVVTPQTGGRDHPAKLCDVVH
jgi:apolipoprotein D and lipocalin family protein